MVHIPPTPSLLTAKIWQIAVNLGTEVDELRSELSRVKQLTKLEAQLGEAQPTSRCMRACVDPVEQGPGLVNLPLENKS